MGNTASDRKNAKFYGLKLSRNTDADIIEYLGTKDNVQGYIKNLVRQDITKEGKVMNICTISSNFSTGREYEVTTKSAMKAAEMYGRCEGGEEVTVSTKSGRILSRVVWSAEDHKYIRVVTE